MPFGCQGFGYKMSSLVRLNRACYNYDMRISELGEFGLIERISALVARAEKRLPEGRVKPLIGIGDDAAAWPGEDTIQLATTDSLVEGVHFTLDNISWQQLGYKALAVNLSDIAAMGGIPRHALVSLALPGNTELDGVLKLYEGILELAAEYEVAIIGGDTTESPIPVISITVLGVTSGNNIRPLTRSSARPGDKIAVTGYLGAAAAGLKILKQNISITAKVSETLKKAFLKPQPRIAEGILLSECGIETAIDISDGLVADLGHILRQSGVGARVDTTKLPIHPMVKESFPDEALGLALSGGEDYELLFCGSDKAIKSVTEKAACPVSIIGEITDNNKCQPMLLDKYGKPYETSETGWEHFAS